MSERSPRRDPRRIHVPAPDPARPGGPPPQPGTPPSARREQPGRSVFVDAPTASAAAGAAAATTAARPGTTAAPSDARSARPLPGSEPAARTTPEPKPAPRPAGKKRRRRPKARRILVLTSLILPLLLVAGLLAGYLYAKSKYDSIEKIPLGDVLSTGGDGTNYLIVGSDTRDPADIEAAGLNPEAFQDGGGNRSDTMMLLRFEGGEAKMMSIPRDLYVPIAEGQGSHKINAAYNGGPQRLVKTVQESLGVPVHHYMEIDFASFAQLVDAMGGITIDFPHPAFDRNSGLDIRQAGPNHLDGPMALAYVRSRHYTEIIDGEEVPDATGDLGRVQRQQTFLTTTFSKLGESKNPLLLAKAAGAASGGLAIDDQMTLTDAIRLGWRMRNLDPTPVPLPVELGRNESGSVLFLEEPGAQAALDQFR